MTFNVYTKGLKQLDGQPTPMLIDEVYNSPTGFVDGWKHNGLWRFVSEDDKERATGIIRVTVRADDN